MYRIVRREQLSPVHVLLEVEAPMVARKGEPGQFIILRVDEDGERIPITAYEFNREKGTVTIIVQVLGATTEKLRHKQQGEYLADFVGPLGKPTELEGKQSIAVVTGGVGTAIALPVARKFHNLGASVDFIAGFRTKELLLLESEFPKASSRNFVCTDDGSYAFHGLVTDKLQALIDEGAHYDVVFSVGPLVMMRAVCRMTEKLGIPTMVSMNPIMIDGTGMCGCCRLTVGGKTMFACVDGPDFDGHQVDWEESLQRGRMYVPWERHKYEETCNLFKKEVQQ